MVHDFFNLLSGLKSETRRSFIGKRAAYVSAVRSGLFRPLQINVTDGVPDNALHAAVLQMHLIVK